VVRFFPIFLHNLQYYFTFASIQSARENCCEDEAAPKNGELKIEKWVMEKFEVNFFFEDRDFWRWKFFEGWNSFEGGFFFA